MALHHLGSLSGVLWHWSLIPPCTSGSISILKNKYAILVYFITTAKRSHKHIFFKKSHFNHRSKTVWTMSISLFSSFERHETSDSQGHFLQWKCDLQATAVALDHTFSWISSADLLKQDRFSSLAPVLWKHHFCMYLRTQRRKALLHINRVRCMAALEAVLPTSPKHSFADRVLQTKP